MKVANSQSAFTVWLDVVLTLPGSSTSYPMTASRISPSGTSNFVLRRRTRGSTSSAMKPTDENRADHEPVRLQFDGPACDRVGAFIGN